MLYIVRHGQSIFNKRNLLCGRSDVSLTEKGFEDARLQGERLKDIGFDYIYCSPMLRTRQTLESILSARNGAPRPEIAYDERIIERDFGYFEGECDKANKTHRRWDMSFDAEQNKMEPIPKLFARVEAFLREIKERHKGQNVLAVTHNGVIRMIKCFFNGFPSEPDIMFLGVKNAQVEVFEI